MRYTIDDLVQDWRKKLTKEYDCFNGLRVKCYARDKGLKISEQEGRNAAIEAYYQNSLKRDI